MKNNKILIFGLMVLVLGVGIFMLNKYFATVTVNVKTQKTVTTSARFVSSTITADGTITAQNQATLNFQTGGKLVYLPFKEGDKILAGQTIAQLDTYQLQRQLSAALNTYRSTRNVFDQTSQNQDKNVIQNQQKITTGQSDTSYLNDVAKRIVDENQANLDNSVVQVELVNYALQMSTLTSPIDGILTHEDVNVSGLNITTATTFKVADPETMVFRANVPTESIYYITVGSNVTLAIDGLANKIGGTVVKIYPSKVVLPSGQAVYQVDIASDELKKQGKLDESGTAIISTNSQNMALVPAWTVLSGKYIWVDNNGQPELKTVTVGKTHGNEIEVKSGLSAGDQIIINPEYLHSLKYKSI